MKTVRNMKILSSAAFFLLAAWTGLSAAETGSFPFFKLITIPENAKDVSVFTLDADIYRETAQIPNGIRIVGPNEEFTPFVIGEETRMEDSTPVESSLPAVVTGFETLPDGSVRISASLSQPAIMNSGEAQVVGLRILTSAKDFDKKMKIYDKTGENLIAEGAFLDYSSRVNLRNDTVRFAVPTREFSFVIVMDNYTEIKDSPFFRVIQGGSDIVEQGRFRESPKIDGISLQIVRKQQREYPVVVSSPVEILSKKNKDKTKTTVVTFSNGSAPLKTISVESSDVFFSRPYRLYDQNRILVASGSIRKLETASFRTPASDCVIEIPTSRSAVWTLELDNGENEELKDIVLHASGPVYQIRFLSTIPAMPVNIVDALKGMILPCYKVFYGASDLPVPNSDFGDVLGLDPHVSSDSSLSPQLPNTRFNGIGVPAWVWNWGLVYKIMMAAAAFAVLLILIVSVKKIDKIKD